MTATLDAPETVDGVPAELAGAVIPPKSKRTKKVEAEAPPGLAVTVGQEALRGALATVVRAAGSDRVLPTLRNVLVEAAGALVTSGDWTGVELTCADLEVRLSVTVGGAVDSDGAYTVPARTLADLVATLPNQAVVLRQDGGVALRVECGTAKTRVKGIAADEFPPLNVPEEAPAFTVPAAKLATAISLVKWAAAPESERARDTYKNLHLSGRADGELRVEAAHGGAAARYRLPDAGVPRFDLLLPPRAADLLARVLEGAGESEGAVQATVRLAPDAERPNHLICTVAHEGQITTLAARLAEGQYADLDRIIPRKFATGITCGRTALLALVRQAAILSDRQEGKEGFPASVLVALDADPAGVLSVSAASAERGEHEASMPAEVVPLNGGAIDAPVRFHLSATYLLGALSQAPGDTVRLRLNGPLTPILVEDTSLDSYRAVLMPMQPGGAK